MGVEIERKFLVDHEKWRLLPKPEGKQYRQGYLADGRMCTVRIRIAGQEGLITIKGPTLGISRKEYEYKIPVNDAAELLESMAKSAVEKTRYCIKFAGKLWEVDEFWGDNTGLIVAEVELNDENEEFEKPGWVANEVSGDVRYYNSSLAVNPFKNWGR